MTTRHTAAILFADVAGSSRLYKCVGDDQAQEVINSIVVEMSAITREHRGIVIKTIGDEIMASFSQAEEAIRAAIAIQQRRGISMPRMQARIGAHYGPVLVRDRDVYGEAVNDAAHLVSIARGGQIITSAATVEKLPDDLETRAVRFDRIPLKGSRDPSIIYLVNWEKTGSEPSADELATGYATQVFAAFTDIQPAAPPARLEIHYQGRRISIGQEDLPFVVGRDPNAKLPVLSSVASRDHFRIDYRRGKFVLKDNSTNGTWVQLEGQDEPMYLRREEAPLTGGGTIAIGRAISADDPHLIRFQI